MSKEKSKDLEKEVVHDPEIEAAEGDYNAPPLSMTDELEKELLEGEREKEKEAERVRSHTSHYNNGVNEWQLIAKTWNATLGWEHVTTAMKVVGGVIVCVKDAIGQKSSMSTTFLPGAILVLKDDKYHIEKQTLWQKTSNSLKRLKLSFTLIFSRK